MAQTTSKRPPGNMPGASAFSGKSRLIAILGAAILLFLIFNIASLKMGGHMMGPTFVQPGNVGLVVDNYNGVIERSLMSAGTHWQGPWETVVEVPTAQRTITLAAADNGTAVQVNTISNMLSVDVSAQYRIDSARARDLYAAYQDQFSNLDSFEHSNLEPAVKGAINYAIGDMDTATALTTAGKQQAEQTALSLLNEEWAPRGVEFSNLMIRGIDQDQASKDLLSTTLAKMQDIENAKLALQQQKFENQTMVAQAQADAKVNQLQNSTLTDLYVQDQMLGKVKRIYMPSDELMSMSGASASTGAGTGGGRGR